ncbi:kinase-like domain-containing protein [Rhizoctonia solani]|nr:kinase-like domain-containing protein [Rhizoctonia solani]
MSRGNPAQPRHRFNRCMNKLTFLLEISSHGGMLPHALADYRLVAKTHAGNRGYPQDRPLTNRVDQDTHRHLPPAPESPGKPHVKRHGNGGKPSTTSRGLAINITHTTNTPNTVTKHIVSSLSVRDQSHTVSPKEISNCSNNLSKRDAINSSHVGPPLQTSSAGLSPPDAEIESASTTSTRRTSITSSRTTSTTATSDTGQSKVLVQSRQMTSSDMFKCLVLHGCNDLTPLINLEKYSSCRIAEGGFGDIWKGQLNDETPVAVKVLRCGLMTCTKDEKKGLKRMMREIYAWSKLDHENVHKLLGVTMYQGRLGMVSKWMVRGNLRDYLGQNQGMDRYNLVATGVEYIHSIDMVHGDLKARSYSYLGKYASIWRRIVKLTDFDYSCLSDFSLLFTETTRVGGGTVRWMAPELVVEICNPRSKEADIYALAMRVFRSTPTHNTLTHKAGDYDRILAVLPGVQK